MPLSAHMSKPKNTRAIIRLRRRSYLNPGSHRKWNQSISRLHLRNTKTESWRIEHVYVKQEPLEAAMKVPFELRREGWRKSVEECIQAGHSHVAVTKKNAVISFRLSKISDQKTFFTSVNLGKAVMQELTTKFQENGGAETTKDSSTKILYLMASCVHPDFGGRGIAREMCVQNMLLGKRFGCRYCVVIASNWMSQHIFEKLKFRELAEIKYADMKAEDGGPLYPNMDPSQKTLKLFVKKLE